MKHDCPEAELEFANERNIQDDKDLCNAFNQLHKIRTEKGFLTYGDIVDVFELEGNEDRKYFLYCGNVRKWTQYLIDLEAQLMKYPNLLNEFYKEKNRMLMALDDQYDAVMED